MARGVFITFEGSEGCGKSTQIELLAARLEARGREVVRTREPGGTPLGEAVRELLKFSAAGAGMCRESEVLLFSASRAQLVRAVIGPALAAGKVVVSDRFHDSTTVYQGVARGIDAVLIGALHRLALGEVRPDLTLVLDMDPDEGRRRAMRRPRPVGAADRMESEPPEFYRKVREGFLELARLEPERVRVIDGAGAKEAVAEAVWKEVARVLGGG